MVEYLGNVVTAFRTVAGIDERSPGPLPGIDSIQPLNLRQVVALLESLVSSSGNGTLG